MSCRAATGFYPTQARLVSGIAGSSAAGTLLASTTAASLAGLLAWTSWQTLVFAAADDAQQFESFGFFTALLVVPVFLTSQGLLSMILPAALLAGLISVAKFGETAEAAGQDAEEGAPTGAIVKFIHAVSRQLDHADTEASLPSVAPARPDTTKSPPDPARSAPSRSRPPGPKSGKE
jgi:hypothetical protein